MFDSERRRWLLGGAAVVPALLGPFAARAANAKLQRIGYLSSTSLSLERHLVDAFGKRLRELGHIEGETIAIESRWAEGRDDRLPAFAAELVRLQPDVIVTVGTPASIAAKKATDAIPIVFASSGDPVSAGLVASFTRPGANVTGFTFAGPELEGKRLQLLQQAVPGLSRVAVLWNSANPSVVGFYQATQTAAAALGLVLQPVVEVQRVEDLKPAFSTVTGAQSNAMIVLADRFLLAHRAEIVNFEATSRLTGIYPYREYVEAGGLMSYNANDIDQFDRTAVYVDKILKGAKPADLPVQNPTKFDLVVNLKTAKALGVTLPPSILAFADTVIE
ncbi:MAG TPA: ABC transporter substrate-binding protein [Bradyrhizobium sp.]|nr:ABC transporter substrate-binding protein [Bradyrhizobium sp.]